MKLELELELEKQVDTMYNSIQSYKQAIKILRAETERLETCLEIEIKRHERWYTVLEDLRKKKNKNILIKKNKH